MTANTDIRTEIWNLEQEMENLRKQGVSEAILEELKLFRREYDTEEVQKERCVRPQMPFFGGEMA